MRVVTEDVIQADDAVRLSLVPMTRDSVDKPPTAIQLLFREIFIHLENDDCKAARQPFMHLIECFQVLHGQFARRKGGVQFRPDFMLDTVHFADYLKPLQDDTDVLREALQRNLI